MNAGSKNERAGACGAGPFRTRENQQLDFASDAVISKAIQVCGLHQLADQTYFRSRWNLFRQLPDLRSVRQMLMEIGGRV